MEQTQAPTIGHECSTADTSFARRVVATLGAERPLFILDLAGRRLAVRRWLIAAVVAALLVPALLATTVGAAPGPDATVTSYLRAMERGDLATAATLVDPSEFGSSSDFFDSVGLTGFAPAAPRTFDGLAVTVESETANSAQVVATYQINFPLGAPVSMQLGATLTRSAAGWRITNIDPTQL
jgi:hypothetical protein